MNFLSGLGSFAGGLAGGIVTGQRMERDRNRERREEERYQREQGLNREAANTFGSIGHQREDGSTYTADNAYEDFASRAAQYDHRTAMQARTEGLQHKAASRQERYAQQEEDVTEFLRRHAGAPDEVFYPAAAKFASRYGNDGKAFGVDFDANAGWQATMIDSNSGQVFRQPIGSRQDLVNQLMSYASPRMYAQSQELGLKHREVGAKERTAAATEGYRRDQAPVLAAQARMYDAHAGAYEAMGNYYAAGGPGGQGGLRMPEGSRIYLTGLQNRETALTKELSELDYSIPGAKQQAEAIRAQLKQLRGEAYDMLSQAKALPPGITRTKFLGLPDPMDAAKRIMTQYGNNHRDFRTYLELFEQEYGSAPEASQALNALKVFEQKQFFGRVHPQHGTPGMPVQPNIPPRNFPVGFPPGPAPSYPAGRPLGLMSNSARNVPPR